LRGFAPIHDVLEKLTLKNYSAKNPPSEKKKFIPAPSHIYIGQDSAPANNLSKRSSEKKQSYHSFPLSIIVALVLVLPFRRLRGVE
jgi:hypothetical protein